MSLHDSVTGVVNNPFIRYALTATGERIGFDMCFSPDCGMHLSRCICEDGPTPPRLGPTAGAVTLEPRSAVAALTPSRTAPAVGEQIVA